MSSSDSEEDCYGNVAKTLQNLKSQYKDDKLRTTNLLDNTTTETSSLEPNVIPNSNDNTVHITFSDDEELDKIIALNTKLTSRSSSRRGRGRGRGVSRKSPDRDWSPSKRQNDDPESGPTIRSKRAKRNATSTQNESVEMVDTNTPTTNSRGRNRGRRGRGRKPRDSRNRPQSCRLPADNNSPTYPTFSIGNTEEYPDESDGIQLFSAKSNNEVINVDDNDLIDKNDLMDENEELSVKVLWQSSEIVKFTIRRFQKLVQIFEFFSNKNSVNVNNLFFTYNDRILKADDTPDSISYNIAKFIDGGIVQQSVTNLITIKDTEVAGGIKLRFQYPNSKKPFEISVQTDDLLSLAMIKCAEHMEMPLKNLKFEFDGDCISGKVLLH